jgi:hypothetical protein
MFGRAVFILQNTLKNAQGETVRANQALYDRLNIINDRIEENERQLSKLLDLYLSNGFPAEMLQEKKSRLEQNISDLRTEQTGISSHLQTVTLSDEAMKNIEAFCSQIYTELECPSFEQKRQIMDILDVRGTLAIENEEKVVYVKCHLGQQQLSVARTSHSSSTGVIAIQQPAYPPTVRSR